MQCAVPEAQIVFERLKIVVRLRDDREQLAGRLLQTGQSQSPRGSGLRIGWWRTRAFLFSQERSNPAKTRAE